MCASSIVVKEACIVFFLTGMLCVMLMKVVSAVEGKQYTTIFGEALNLSMSKLSVQEEIVAQSTVNIVIIFLYLPMCD
jgi:hypothetical protein